MVSHERDVSRYADQVVTLVDGSVAEERRTWVRIALRKVLRDLWLARGRTAVLVAAMTNSLMQMEPS